MTQSTSYNFPICEAAKLLTHRYKSDTWPGEKTEQFSNAMFQQ